MWPTTTSESSTDSKGIQYLYIQMEYCEKNTLRNLIDDGLFKDQEKVWRLVREIVEGLAHIHSQVIKGFVLFPFTKPFRCLIF